MKMKQRLFFGALFFILVLSVVTRFLPVLIVFACLLFLALVPTIMGLVLDPINKMRICSHCAALGFSEVKIDVFPNHYGVHFLKDGKRCYAKCAMRGFKLKWNGTKPEEC